MATGQGKAVTGLRKEFLGPPGMGGNCRQAVEAGGWGSHSGGRLLYAQAIWGEGSDKWVQGETEAASTDERFRSEMR